MPDGLIVTINPHDQRKFAGLIDEMSKMTARETPVIVRNVARDFVKQAIRHTPIVKKKFKTVNVFMVRGKDGKPISPTVWRKGSPVKKMIMGRGFARSGWAKALFGLGLTPSHGLNIKHIGHGSIKHGYFIDGLQREVPFVEVGNRVPYIETLDKGGPRTRAHHILDKTIVQTITQMERTLSRLSERMKNQWR